MGNSLGKVFTITSLGESHGDCIGIVIDGCPAGLPIHVDEIQAEADRRKSGPRALATTRKEDDKIEFFLESVIVYIVVYIAIKDLVDFSGSVMMSVSKSFSFGSDPADC